MSYTESKVLYSMSLVKLTCSINGGTQTEEGGNYYRFGEKSDMRHREHHKIGCILSTSEGNLSSKAAASVVIYTALFGCARGLF